MQRLNAFTAKGVLRRYQLDVLLQGAFDWPIDGCRCQYVLPGAAIFYRFEGAEPTIVMAASLKDGFPILCAITQDHVVWVDKPERADLVPFARTLLREQQAERVNLQKKPAVWIGDPNFAHFLWNEFPALCAVAHRTTAFNIRLFFDPMGIVPKFADEHQITVHQMPSRSCGKGWTATPAVMLGSIYCDADVLQTVHRLMDLSERSQQGPRLWLTLRDHGRTMENQLDFLSSLIATVHRQSPETIFFLDGFSTAMDLDAPIYDPLRASFADRIAGAKQLAGQLMAAHPRARIHDMTGAPLGRALRALSTCTFYVAHAGTMQHKAAWFYPLPGLQHGNHASLSPAALRWAAQMIETAQAPLGLPSTQITDGPVNARMRTNDRNRDYAVSDIPKTVSAVCDLIAEHATNQPVF